MSAALHCAARADWVAIMVEIRPAAAKDAAGIATVQTEVWRDAYAGLLPVGYRLHRAAVQDLRGAGFSEAILWCCPATLGPSPSTRGRADLTAALKPMMISTASV
jgi:hypothetical protein